MAKGYFAVTTFPNDKDSNLYPGTCSRGFSGHVSVMLGDISSLPGTNILWVITWGSLGLLDLLSPIEIFSAHFWCLMPELYLKPQKQGAAKPEMYVMLENRRYHWETIRCRFVGARWWL